MYNRSMNRASKHFIVWNTCNNLYAVKFIFSCYWWSCRASGSRPNAKSMSMSPQKLIKTEYTRIAYATCFYSGKLNILFYKFRVFF